MTLEQQRAIAIASAKAKLAKKTAAPSQLEAGMRGLGQGGTAGFIDEGVGLVNTVGSMRKFNDENAPRYVNPADLFNPQKMAEMREQQKQQIGQAREAGDAARDAYRARDAAAREAHPGTFMTGEVTGLVGTSFVPLGVGVKGAQVGTNVVRATKAKPVVDALARVTPNVAKKYAPISAKAAAASGLYSAGVAEEDKLDAAKTGALVGAFAGPVAAKGTDLAVKGVGKLAGGLENIGRKLTGTSKKLPPTMEEISEKASAAYAKADANKDLITPEAFAKTYDDIVAYLADDAYLPGNQPGVAAALKELSRIKDTGLHVTYKGLEAARRKILGGFNPQNRDNNRMLFEIRDMVDNLGSNSGYAPARALYAQKAQMESIKTAIEQGTKNAKATGIGGNVDNAIRQQLRKVDKHARGWTPAAKKQLENAAYGTAPRNVARAVGRAAPSTGALTMTGLGVAGFSGFLNPATVSAAIGAEMVKFGATRSTKNAAMKAMKIIANEGKPLDLPTLEKIIRENPEARQVIMRALLSLGIATGAQAGQP